MTLDSSYASDVTANSEPSSPDLPNLVDQLFADAIPAENVKHQNTGFGNVAGQFMHGVGDKALNDPGSVAVNGAMGYGLGLLVNKGLASAVWRKPTIGGLVAATGLAAYELTNAVPGWKKSYDVASNPFAYDPETVQQAEKHIHSLGGSALVMGAGGVGGSLAIKSGISMSAESMLAKTRATMFGENAVAAGAKEGAEVVAKEGAAILPDKGVTKVRFGDDVSDLGVHKGRDSKAFKFDDDGKVIVDNQNAMLVDELNGIKGINATSVESSSAEHARGVIRDSIPLVKETDEQAATTIAAKLRGERVAENDNFPIPLSPGKDSPAGYRRTGAEISESGRTQGLTFAIRRAIASSKEGIDGSTLRYDESGNLLMVDKGFFSRQYLRWEDGKIAEIINVDRSNTLVRGDVKDGVYTFELPTGGTAKWRGELNTQTGEWMPVPGEIATPDMAMYKGAIDNLLARANNYLPGFTESRLGLALRNIALPESLLRRMYPTA